MSHGFARTLILAAVGAAMAIAQEQAPPAPAGGGGAAGGAGGGNVGGAGGGGNIGGTTRPGGNIPTQPGIDPRQQFPEIPRPIFISGKVMLEDGTPPPETVVIERVCGGIARPEDYTDSKGRFSFEVGRNQGMFNDASYGSDRDPLASGGGFGGPIAAIPAWAA
jgi:hypothetical protein